MVDGIPTYIAFCCREWIAAYGHKGGRCGLCGQTPTFLREDEQSWWPTSVTSHDPRP